MKTDAQKRAQERYNINHDRLYLYLEFGTLAKIDKTGIKRQNFIKQAINEKLERLQGAKK